VPASPGRCSLPPLSLWPQHRVPSLCLPPPPTPVSLTLLQTMRGICRLQWLVPRSTSCQKLPKFISLSLCLAFTWPGLWQAFPFGVLMLPGTVCFIEVPLSTSFFIFSSNHLSTIHFGCFSCSLKILFLFPLNTCPLATCGGVCKDLYTYYHTSSIRHVYLHVFVFLYIHLNINIPTTAYDA
jgi:hypothetical protein